MIFDPNVVKQGRQEKPYTGDPLPNIDHLNEGQLLTLYARVESKLPPAKLSHLNLDEELVRQLQRAKALQSAVMEDIDVAANQKAQVLNATGTALNQLINMQERLYNAERFKALELLIIEAVKAMPMAQAEKFLDAYETLAMTKP